LFSIKLEKNKFILLLALINFIAGIYSCVVYYGHQLLSSNPVFWIFIPDCPLYVFLFGIVLLWVYLGKTHFTLLRKINLFGIYIFGKKGFPVSLLGLITIIGLLKYAMWTFFVLTATKLLFFDLLYPVAHFFMGVQAVVLIGFFVFERKDFVIALVWFLLNDFFDYFVLTHPVFPKIIFEQVMIFSIASTIFFSVMCYLFWNKNQNENSNKVESENQNKNHDGVQLKKRVKKKSLVKFRKK
jgi:uncharacterized membrane protein YpjA